MNEFKILEPEIFANYPVSAGLTLKNEVLFPPFGFSVGQAKIYSQEEVTKHVEYLANIIKADKARCKFVYQTHSADVYNIDSEFESINGDGLATIERNLALCVKLADCAGILLYDTESGAVSAIHSGWRGTVQNIAKSGIILMIKEYKSNPKNILAYISPCAGKEEYEVKYDVAEHFEGFRVQTDEEHYLIDIKGKIADQLIQSGLSVSNIEIAKESTINSPEFHSYRRDKDSSGRMGLYIMAHS